MTVRIRIGGIARIIGFVALVMASGSGAARASAPVCYPNNGNWYCDYSGTVASAYVNSSNWILLYFDTPIDPSILSSAGISGVSVYSAALYVMSDNPDFGKALYATLLTAQARGATINVQMSSAADGYLVMDRVWVSQ